jgi:hypothetical protein
MYLVGGIHPNEDLKFLQGIRDDAGVIVETMEEEFED